MYVWHFSTFFDYICRLSHLYKPTEVEELMDRRDRIHSRLYTKLICTLCEPTPQPEREIFQTGQSGYWVSTLGGPNYLDFWQKLNIFQGDYCILWIGRSSTCANIGLSKTILLLQEFYSMVKDSNADLGVNFCIILIFQRAIIFIFWIFNLKQPFLTRTNHDYGPILESLVFNVKFALLSLTIL